MTDNIDAQFNAEASERAREASITQVERAADDAWKAVALAVVEQICRLRSGGEFTTDAVWYLLGLDETIPPREPRALGPVMRRAQAAGFCASTERFHLSTRVRAHRKPQRVWRSLL